MNKRKQEDGQSPNKSFRFESIPNESSRTRESVESSNSNSTIANPKQVANHYNSRRQVGVKERINSPIYHMKNFNNWIKSMLFRQFVRRGDVALDVACGKGGDLLKWYCTVL